MPVFEQLEIYISLPSLFLVVVQALASTSVADRQADGNSFISSDRLISGLRNENILSYVL